MQKLSRKIMKTLESERVKIYFNISEYLFMNDQLHRR